MVLQPVILSKPDQVRLRIFEAVNRPISEMSVKDICNNAGISRQTFYNHFESKYDISLWFSYLIDDMTLREIGRTTSWEEGLLAYFLAIHERRTFYALTGQNKLSDNHQGRRTAERHRSDEIRETLSLRGVVEISPELAFCITYYTRAECSAIGDWMRSGCAAAPTQMASNMYALVPQLLRDALSL